MKDVAMDVYLLLTERAETRRCRDILLSRQSKASKHKNKYTSWSSQPSIECVYPGVKRRYNEDTASCYASSCCLELCGECLEVPSRSITALYSIWTSYIIGISYYKYGADLGRKTSVCGVTPDRPTA